MSDFTLHPRLAQDTFTLGDWPLSRVLLMNNQHFPWLILVPRLPDLREITDLSEAHYATLMLEIRSATAALQQHLTPTKINIGMLGNQVPQLHAHVIARFEGDVAWPNPVWGGAAAAYTPAQLAEVATGLKRALFG